MPKLTKDAPQPLFGLAFHCGEVPRGPADRPRIQYSRDDLPPFIQTIHHRREEKKTEKKRKRERERRTGKKSNEKKKRERERTEGTQVSVTSC